MNQFLFSIFKDAFFLLFRRPLYILLSTIASLPENIPISIRVEDMEAFARNLLTFPFFASLFSHGNFPGLFFLFCAGLFLWLIKIAAFSYVCLDILSQKKNRSEQAPNFRRACFFSPRIALVRIASFLFFAILLYLLILPVQTLVTVGAFASAWFLGFFALLIFLGAGASFFSTFLFAQFYILFARIPVRTAFHTAAKLFLAHKKLSLLFSLWTGVLFLLFPALLSLLPGFVTDGFTFMSNSSEIPLTITFTSFLLNSLLSILLSTLFPIVATLFFLRIAKKKKKRTIKAADLETILSPLLKKKSEATQEMK